MILGTLLIVFCSSSDDFSITLSDGTEPAGNFRIMWPQTDSNDELVAAGTYSVRMSTADFHENWEFRISSSFPSVSAANDSMFCAAGALPVAYQVSLNATAYAPGDTVLICCALPAASDLKVTVVRH